MEKGSDALVLNLRDVSLVSVLWLLTHSRCLQGNNSSQLTLRGLAVTVWSCVSAAQAVGLPVGSWVLQWPPCPGSSAAVQAEGWTPDPCNLRLGVTLWDGLC